jgi:hypothetical protein
MLPAINILIPHPPVQTPLVATALSDAIALRVPPDNVAPSVSSPHIDPNARGNSNQLPPPSAPASAAASPSLSPGISGGFFTSTGSGFWLSPQATFLAQMIDQDYTPQTRVVLVQYERLMNLGNVKYRPSDAAKPAAEPAGLFGRLLREEQAMRAPQPPAASGSAMGEKAVAVASVQSAARPQLQRVAKPSAKTASGIPARLPSQAMSAYQVSLTRNAALAPKVSAEPESIEKSNIPT